MLTLPTTVRVFAATEPVDGRKGIDGLAGVVRAALQRAPLNGDLYLFLSRRRDRARVLYFAHTSSTVAEGAEGAEGQGSAWAAGISAVQQVGLTTWDWATLFQRVWDVDALKCEGCGGRMKFIALIKDRAVVERILKHIGEDAEEPRFARARDPYNAWQ